MLEKLDRSWLASTFASNKLKMLISKQRHQLDYAPGLNNKEILAPNDFLIGDKDSGLSDAPENLRF